MATWRWSEKIDLQVTYRHSSNLANVERKHNSGVKKRTSKDCKETKCHRTVKSDCRLFLKTKVWNPKAKTTANLRIVYFPTNISLKKWRTNSSVCYGKKILIKLTPVRKRVFNIHFGHPLCDNVTLKHLPCVKAFFPGRDTKAFATMVQERWWQWQCCRAKCQLLQGAWTPSSILPGWNIPSVLRIQDYSWWGS